MIGKIDLRRIVELRPASDSSADIARSLAEAAAERERAVKLYDDIKAQRGAVLARGTAEDIERQKAPLDDLTAYVSDLEAFMQDLAPELPKAQTREKIAALQAERDALDYAGKVDDFVQRFEGYAPAAAIIRDIMQSEQVAEAALTRELTLCKALTALGVETPAPVNAYRHVTGGPLANFPNFGAMVRLPGVLGAPQIPRVYTRIEKIVDVERPDWDSPRLGKDATGLPLARKFVQETVEEHLLVADRQDEAFWWPKDTGAGR
jgi:hypothetical protein